MHHLGALTAAQTILIVAFLLAPSKTDAGTILRPEGLDPGDEYRLAFVTDRMRNALSPTITIYNSFVTVEAGAGGSLVADLDADWFAIASTPSVDAIVNTGTDPSPPGDNGVPIYLVDGETLVADHYDRLWGANAIGGNLLAPVNLTQFGLPPDDPSNNVWTGTTTQGLAGGLGGPLGTTSPSLGASIATNSRWIDNAFSSGGSVLRSFYAISSVLVAVPEPSSALLLGVAFTAVLIRR